MTSRTHVSLVSAIQAKVEPVVQEATADAILAFRRELREIVIEDLGRLYVYEPQSVTEREAYQKHMRIDEAGMSISMLGMVDGIMARVRNKSGDLLFSSADRPRLLSLPAERIMAIWSALGGDSGKLSKDLVDHAEKK